MSQSIMNATFITSFGELVMSLANLCPIEFWYKHHFARRNNGRLTLSIRSWYSLENFPIMSSRWEVKWQIFLLNQLRI